MKNSYDNVVIEASIENGSLDNLENLKNSPLLKNAKNVSIVSVYNEKMAKYLPCHIVDKKDFNEIQQSIEVILKDLRDKIIPVDANPAHWHVEVIFNNDVKHMAVEFLRNRNADLAIISTRGFQGISGFFEDSFAFYMVQHAPCDVHVLRPIH